ncbi:MAG: hypothetical protein Q9227_002219 [Pyrenula ochraceoflavens]
MESHNQIEGEAPQELIDRGFPDRNLPEQPQLIQQDENLKQAWQNVQDLYAIVLRSKIRAGHSLQTGGIQRPEWIGSPERNKLRRIHGPYLMLGLHYLFLKSSQAEKNTGGIEKQQWESIAKETGTRLLEFSNHDCIKDLLHAYRDEKLGIQLIRLALDQAVHSKELLERKIPLPLQCSSDLPLWQHWYKVWAFIICYLESEPPGVKENTHIMSVGQAKFKAEEIAMRILYLDKEDS